MKTATKEAARLIHEGALALAEIEANGVRVDEPYLDEQITKARAEIKDLAKQLRHSHVYRAWRKAYAEKANLGSRDQLGKVIFDRLGLPRGTEAKEKKFFGEEGEGLTRKAKYDESAFSHLLGDPSVGPFVETYFRCEKLKKLKGTYLEGIKREMVDGFVHPVYNLHTVQTYRSSCSMPNWQNILARNPALSKIIRRCYIPRKGRQLVENDWSQIEVRIAACYNKDPKLMAYIRDPATDMHRDWAMKLFMLGEDQIEKKTTRDWAKNRFVFPTFYGQVYFQCAQDLWRGVLSGAKLPNGKTVREHLREKGIKELGDCTPGADTRKGTFVHHVKEVEQQLWQTFSVYAQWKRDWWDAYLKNGGFRLLTGFWIEGVFKRNDVGNYPVQGSAFHCELQALIYIVKELKRCGMKTLLIGEIHDCDNADAVPSELQDYLGMVHEIKTKRVPEKFKWINVPLEAEAEVCGVDSPWDTKAVWTCQNGTWKPKV